MKVAGRDVAGDGEEDHVVTGGGDAGHQRPAYAADSGALRGSGIQRIAGPAAVKPSRVVASR